MEIDEFEQEEQELKEEEGKEIESPVSKPKAKEQEEVKAQEKYVAFYQ